MRTVVSNHEVARLWAAQSQSHAGNSTGSIWFDDDTIYSYGRHFPIARILPDNVVLFTTRLYSVTTTGHCSEVMKALAYGQGVTLIPVRDPCALSRKARRQNFDIMKQEHMDLLARAKRRRLPGPALYDLENAARTAKAANAYSKLYKLRVRIR